MEKQQRRATAIKNVKSKKSKVGEPFGTDCIAPIGGYPIPIGKSDFSYLVFDCFVSGKDSTAALSRISQSTGLKNTTQKQVNEAYEMLKKTLDFINKVAKNLGKTNV